MELTGNIEYRVKKLFGYDLVVYVEEYGVTYTCPTTLSSESGIRWRKAKIEDILKINKLTTP